MKKTISILLCALFLCGMWALPAAAVSDYRIVSPYADVVWNGDGAWGAYKGNLHTHSTFSDAMKNSRASPRAPTPSTARHAARAWSA